MKEKNESQFVTVRFSNEDEFLEEIKKDGPNIEPIIRTTKSFEPTHMAAHIVYVSVIATALRFYPQTRITQRIKLQRFCGDYWGKDFSDAAIKKADSILTRIEAAALKLNLEVRAGVYE